MQQWFHLSLLSSYQYVSEVCKAVKYRHWTALQMHHYTNDAQHLVLCCRWQHNTRSKTATSYRAISHNAKPTDLHNSASMLSTPTRTIIFSLTLNLDDTWHKRLQRSIMCCQKKVHFYIYSWLSFAINGLLLLFKTNSLSRNLQSCKTRLDMLCAGIERRKETNL